MARISVSVSASGDRELRALARRLNRAAAVGLRRRVNEELREAGRPALKDLRAAVMAVQVKSSRGGRARPRRTTFLRARTRGQTKLHPLPMGIQFKVDAHRVSRTHPNLVRYLEAAPGFVRWMHPVFGNRRVWARQTGENWFFVTVHKHVPRFRQAAQAAVRKTTEMIARG